MAQELVIIGGSGIKSRGAIPLPALFAPDAATASVLVRVFSPSSAARAPIQGPEC